MLSRLFAAALALLLAAAPAAATPPLTTSVSPGLSFPTRVLMAVDNVNCNALADTQFAFLSPTANWRVGTIYVQGLTGAFTTAKVGVYSAASQGGTQVLAQTALSAITTTTPNLSTSGVQLSGTMNNPYNFNTLYLNVGTAQGAACTLSAYVEIVPLP